MDKAALLSGKAVAIRRYALAVYILINIIAAYWIIDSRELIGDLKQKPYDNPEIVILAAVLVVGCYFIILSPIYRLLDKIKVKPVSFRLHDDVIGDRLGVVLLGLQIGFLIFCSYYGVNIAGAGNIKPENQALSYFFILVDPDFLFFIYYGLYRDNKKFSPNMAIWILSNLSRGWNGIFIFILFFECCRMYRLRSFTVPRVFAVGLAILICYPILDSAKWIIRVAAFSGVNYGTLIPEILNRIEFANYFQLIWTVVENAIGRLQVVSLLVEVIESASTLQADFYAFKFLPFWLEGLHGIAFDRFFSGTERLSIGVVMTQYLNPESNFEGVGTTNISYPGWFFISPLLGPFYVIYTIALGFLSMYFIKKNQNSNAARDIVWLVWLMYLLPPWLGAMVKFIYSAMIFLGLRILVSKFHRHQFVTVVKNANRTPHY